MGFLRRIAPDAIARHVQDIDYESLRARGIVALIFDLDNTLLPWNDMSVREDQIEWMRDLRARGFSVAILSNNGEARIRPIAEALGCEYLPNARKPGVRGFQEALRVLGVRADRCAVVGDQLFTDMWGGRRAGLHTILVEPLAESEFAGTRITRCIERIALRRLGIRRGGAR